MSHPGPKKGLVFLLALALALASCSRAPEGGNASKRGGAPERWRVRIIYLPFLSFGPLIIAYEEGYFAEQGIKVEFVPLKRSVHGLGPLANGELDVLAGSVSSGILNAIARGADIRIVADKGHISAGPDATSALLARRGLMQQGKLKDPDALKGLRLAASKDNIEGYFVDRAFARLGVSLDDLQMSDPPSPVLPDALRKGALDFAWVTEPWLTRVLAAGDSEIWVRDHEIIPGFQYAFVAFGPSLLRENPELGERFMVAYLKGVRQYNQGKVRRNIEILAQHTKLDPELLRNATWPSIRNDGQINLESVLAFQEWAVEEGLIEAPLRPESFWNPRFIERAGAVLGKAGGEPSAAPVKKR